MTVGNNKHDWSTVRTPTESRCVMVTTSSCVLPTFLMTRTSMSLHRMYWNSLCVHTTVETTCLQGRKKEKTQTTFFVARSTSVTMPWRTNRRAGEMRAGTGPCLLVRRSWRSSTVAPVSTMRFWTLILVRICCIFSSASFSFRVSRSPSSEYLMISC